MQFELLHHLVKDTRKGINKDRAEAERIAPKYDLSSKHYTFENMEYWWKSRESKDDCGCNALHHVFAIDEPDKRNEFLELCIGDHIGNISKRNKQGLLPQEIEHIQPVKPPKKLRDLEEFLETKQEIEEADYMIVTSQNVHFDDKGEATVLGGKKNLVLTQLKQLGLAKHTTEHPLDKYFATESPIKQSLTMVKKLLGKIFCCCCRVCQGGREKEAERTNCNERQYVLLSIKIPNEIMDQKAEKLSISANLCHTFC